MTFNPVDSVAKEYPIRNAFQNFYSDYASKHVVSKEQVKAASCISLCKTGRLGYTAEECPDCGFKRIHARSCNNRNCPCCQAPQEQKWVTERNSELISGAAYYHVVFTVPHDLNSLMLENPKLLYGLLFSAASDTLITLCRDKKYMGALPGIVSVLHTWGQKLNYHPHLHVMLSGAGLTADGRLVYTKHKGFIIPVKVVGKMFRGKFMFKLKAYHEAGLLSLKGTASRFDDPKQWQALVDKLYTTDWVPFIKETFNGNGNAIKYLARYAYRTAISNSRVSCDDSEDVSVSYKDYADGNKKKVMTVKGTEFIRLFLQHVLPSGVHHVRFSGFLANCKKTKSLTLIGKLLRTPYTGSPTKGKCIQELLSMMYGTDICSCPVCNQKMFQTVYIRAPALT